MMKKLLLFLATFLLLCQPLNSYAILKHPKLISAYRFEGNSNDWSVNADNGTDTAITYSTTTTKFGKTASFNGTTSKIVLPNSQPTSTFSIVGWFKRASSAREDPLYVWVSADNATYYKIEFGAYGGADIDRLQVGFRDTAPNYIWKGTTTKVTDTNWHHFAVTQNGAANPVIYLDGLQETLVTLDSGGTAALPASSQPRTMGFFTWTSATAFFSGNLDEFRMYNKVLTSAEIREDMMGFLPGEGASF
jgi:hypothetical protein